MSKHWFDYVKSCYDLVLESEGTTGIILEHEVEAYIVHLLANNFTRTDIGTKIIAFEMLNAANSKNTKDFIKVGDECLLIQSYPIKKQKWPSQNYYIDMGTIAYGMANHIMENNFRSASKILNGIFNRI